MGESPVPEICAAYDISKERFKVLIALPVFQQAFAAAQETLQKEGMSFRVKARMQSEALLETSWALIHALHTPANVKADMIKATWKVGGLEPKENTGNLGAPLQINIHL